MTKKPMLNLRAKTERRKGETIKEFKAKLINNKEQTSNKADIFKKDHDIAIFTELNTISRRIYSCSFNDCKEDQKIECVKELISSKLNTISEEKYDCSFDKCEENQRTECIEKLIESYKDLRKRLSHEDFDFIFLENTDNESPDNKLLNSLKKIYNDQKMLIFASIFTELYSIVRKKFVEEESSRHFNLFEEDKITECIKELIFSKLNAISKKKHSCDFHDCGKKRKAECIKELIESYGDLGIRLSQEDFDFILSKNNDNESPDNKLLNSLKEIYNNEKISLFVSIHINLNIITNQKYSIGYLVCNYGKQVRCFNQVVQSNKKLKSILKSEVLDGFPQQICEDDKKAVIEFIDSVFGCIKIHKFISIFIELDAIARGKFSRTFNDAKLEQKKTCVRMLFDNGCYFFQDLNQKIEELRRQGRDINKVLLEFFEKEFLSHYDFFSEILFGKLDKRIKVDISEGRNSIVMKAVQDMLFGIHDVFSRSNFNCFGDFKCSKEFDNFVEDELHEHKIKEKESYISDKGLKEYFECLREKPQDEEEFRVQDLFCDELARSLLEKIGIVYTEKQLEEHDNSEKDDISYVIDAIEKKSAEEHDNFDKVYISFLNLLFDPEGCFVNTLSKDLLNKRESVISDSIAQEGICPNITTVGHGLFMLYKQLKKDGKESEFEEYLVHLFNYQNYEDEKLVSAISKYQPSYLSNCVSKCFLYVTLFLSCFSTIRFPFSQENSSNDALASGSPDYNCEEQGNVFMCAFKGEEITCEVPKRTLTFKGEERNFFRLDDLSLCIAVVKKCSGKNSESEIIRIPINPDNFDCEELQSSAPRVSDIVVFNHGNKTIYKGGKEYVTKDKIYVQTIDATICIYKEPKDGNFQILQQLCKSLEQICDRYGPKLFDLRKGFVLNDCGVDNSGGDLPLTHKKIKVTSSEEFIGASVNSDTYVNVLGDVLKYWPHESHNIKIVYLPLFEKEVPFIVSDEKDRFVYVIPDSEIACVFPKYKYKNRPNSYDLTICYHTALRCTGKITTAKKPHEIDFSQDKVMKVSCHNLKVEPDSGMQSAAEENSKKEVTTVKIPKNRDKSSSLFAMASQASEQCESNFNSSVVIASLVPDPNFIAGGSSGNTLVLQCGDTKCFNVHDKNSKTLFHVNPEHGTVQQIYPNVCSEHNANIREASRDGIVVEYFGTQYVLSLHVCEDPNSPTRYMVELFSYPVNTPKGCNTSGVCNPIPLKFYFQTHEVEVQVGSLLNFVTVINSLEISVSSDGKKIIIYSHDLVGGRYKKIQREYRIEDLFDVNSCPIGNRTEIRDSSAVVAFPATVVDHDVKEIIHENLTVQFAIYFKREVNFKTVLENSVNVKLLDENRNVIDQKNVNLQISELQDLTYNRIDRRIEVNSLMHPGPSNNIYAVGLDENFSAISSENIQTAKERILDNDFPVRDCAKIEAVIVAKVEPSRALNAVMIPHCHSGGAVPSNAVSLSSLTDRHGNTAIKIMTFHDSGYIPNNVPDRVMVCSTHAISAGISKCKYSHSPFILKNSNARNEGDLHAFAMKFLSEGKNSVYVQAFLYVYLKDSVEGEIVPTLKYQKAILEFSKDPEVSTDESQAVIKPISQLSGDQVQERLLGQGMKSNMLTTQEGVCGQRTRAYNGSAIAPGCDLNEDGQFTLRNSSMGVDATTPHSITSSEPSVTTLALNTTTLYNSTEPVNATTSAPDVFATSTIIPNNATETANVTESTNSTYPVLNTTLSYDATEPGNATEFSSYATNLDNFAESTNATEFPLDTTTLDNSTESANITTSAPDVFATSTIIPNNATETANVTESTNSTYPVLNTTLSYDATEPGNATEFSSYATNLDNFAESTNATEFPLDTTTLDNSTESANITTSAPDVFATSTIIPNNATETANVTESTNSTYPVLNTTLSYDATEPGNVTKSAFNTTFSDNSTEPVNATTSAPDVFATSTIIPNNATETANVTESTNSTYPVLNTTLSYDATEPGNVTKSAFNTTFSDNSTEPVNATTSAPDVFVPSTIIPKNATETANVTESTNSIYPVLNTTLSYDATEPGNVTKSAFNTTFSDNSTEPVNATTSAPDVFVPSTIIQNNSTELANATQSAFDTTISDNSTQSTNATTSAFFTEVPSKSTASEDNLYLGGLLTTIALLAFFLIRLFVKLNNRLTKKKNTILPIQESDTPNINTEEQVVETVSNNSVTVDNVVLPISSTAPNQDSNKPPMFLKNNKVSPSTDRAQTSYQLKNENNTKLEVMPRSKTQVEESKSSDKNSSKNNSPLHFQITILNKMNAILHQAFHKSSPSQVEEYSFSSLYILFKNLICALDAPKPGLNNVSKAQYLKLEQKVFCKYGLFQEKCKQFALNVTSLLQSLDQKKIEKECRSMFEEIQSLLNNLEIDYRLFRLPKNMKDFFSNKRKYLTTEEERDLLLWSKSPWKYVKGENGSLLAIIEKSLYSKLNKNAYTESKDIPRESSGVTESSINKLEGQKQANNPITILVTDVSTEEEVINEAYNAEVNFY